MTVFSKCGRLSLNFSCFDSLEPYKCRFCAYTTYERTGNCDHKCRSANVLVEPFFKRCHRCKEGSYSYLWYYFHENTCNFDANCKEIERTHKACVCVTKQFAKWLQCEQCKYTTKKKTI